MVTKAALVLAYNMHQKIFWGLCTLMLLSSGFYVYFISVSIMNVVLREEMLLEISQVHSRISELEATYLAKKNDVDGTALSELGFTPLGHKEFVPKSSAPTNLTFNQ